MSVSPSTIEDVPLPLLSAQSLLQSRTGPAVQSLPKLLRMLELWHLASLDAPTVSIVWSCAFAWVAGVHLEPWTALLLACGTWTVYIGDRLLDTRRALHTPAIDDLRERHYFHWRHRHALLPIAAGTATIAALLILRLMPLAVCKRDSVIAAAALAYFSGVHSPARLPEWMRPILSKEFLVGVLFTAGCVAPTMSHLHWKLATNWPVLICVLFFALLAWLNCAAIETWESSEHRRIISSCAAALIAVGVIVALVFLRGHDHSSALLATGSLSALLLLRLDRMRHRIAPVTLRAFADLVLLTPAILLTFGTHHG